MLDLELVAKAIVVYTKRWAIEEVHRQMKQSMKWETMRLGSYQGMKNLIFDLRGNGGGYLNTACEIADEFIENERVIVYTDNYFANTREVRNRALVLKLTYWWN